MKASTGAMSDRTLTIISLVVCVLLAIGLTVAIVRIVNLSKTDHLLYDMKMTCERSYGVVDGALEAKCGQLIDQVQAKGFEVLNKDGEFWAEYNANANSPQ